MIKSDLYSELSEIAVKSSYKQIFDLLYLLSQFRYATFKQLHQINHRVATKKFLVKLCELGYLDTTKNLQAYKTNQKTWEVLEKEGYNTKIIQTNLTGETLEHELKITNVLLKLQTEPDFYKVIYPNFTTLIPDFCVIWKRENSYKIEFGEVEEPKFDWEQYIQDKEAKYKKLSGNIEVYSKWWKHWSGMLELPYCKQEDFCFFYRIIKNEKLERLL